MVQTVTLRVRVSHGDPLVSAGLAWHIAREPGFALQPGPQAGEAAPDVIVVDHAGALQLLAAAPERGAPRIVVVSCRAKEGEIAQAVDRGAHAYLFQHAEPAELMAAIRHVARGGAVYLCRSTLAALGQRSPRAGLTAREQEVLRFLVKGACNKRIARSLDISASTVKAHVSRICEKLHAGSRVQVAMQATRRGLLGG